MDSTEEQERSVIETTAIVCGHVYREERPVKLVIHHADGVWQLVCGESDHPEDCCDFEPVCLEHVTERQGNLSNVADLERGCLAECDDSGNWHSSQLEDDA